MGLTFWTERRIAGGALSMSFLVLVFALVIMLTSGAMPGFTAMLQGELADVVPFAATFRLLILIFAIGWVIQLLGVSLLGRLMWRAGEEQLATLAFSLILFSVIAGVLYSTFRMTVELWAAGEAARTGTVPALLEPFKAWTGSFFGLGYRAHFLATAGIGWGLIRSRLVGPSVGWAAIGLSILFFLGALIGASAPAAPFIVPAVIGVTLLWG